MGSNGKCNRLLVQQLGLNIIPSNYSEIVNTVLSILTMVGIIVDTSTTGLSDKIVTKPTEIEKIENSNIDKQV